MPSDDFKSPDDYRNLLILVTGFLLSILVRGPLYRQSIAVAGIKEANHFVQSQGPRSGSVPGK
ncbi:MAG: hypothetical protein A2437_08385 [Bacteroidetes bacterium RIFOXYC2_FULL_40_12]|nr:MAG: hypothetical protein A2437_08385 [Bacteroidetes bacterium RIFOXYC2_FULL_40_12]